MIDIDDELGLGCLFSEKEREQQEQTALERAKAQYKLVQGERPSWARLPNDTRAAWIAGAISRWSNGALPRHGDGQFTSDHDLSGSEFDLARNRELASELRGQGHNPIVRTAPISWLDGRLTKEEVVGEKCRPAGRGPNQCPKCCEEIYGPAQDAAVLFTRDPLSDPLSDEVNDLRARVMDLESANGGHFIEEALAFRDGTNPVRPMGGRRKKTRANKVSRKHKRR